MTNAKVALIFVFAWATLQGVLVLKQEEKELVRNLHNKIRSKVVPTARNMLEMSWDDAAAKLAQSWANQCQRMYHDNSSIRIVFPYGICGQNTYTSSVIPPNWTAPIMFWKNEDKDFTYNSTTNVFLKVGHYTQLVWEWTHRVGCGYAACKDARGNFSKYVCNYCPRGNGLWRIGTPYISGPPCKACPSTCVNGTLCKVVPKK